jgi:hypothetical protein
MEKILITGTGRCGTTFLIKLFSFLEFDTGYNRENYIKSIFANCNSGMERKHNENYYILKNPCFISNIKNILEDVTIKIKLVIIPIRDFKLSAISRVKNDKKCGGLWNANDEITQIQYYKDIITNYIYYMTKYDINTIFIDFDKMVSDKEYLFNKIKSILDEKNIDFDVFCKVYDEVTVISKP